MKVLFASAELFPFSKSGGLADMAFALPHALGKEGVDIVAVTPLYSFVNIEKYHIERTAESLRCSFGGKSYEITLYRTCYRGLEILFIYHPLLCDRPYLYGPPGGSYPDNDLRFALFCHALVELAKFRETELLHLNDWHTALTPLLLHDAGLRIPSLYTIHNLAYQGTFPPETLERCGIDRRHFHLEELEFYGEVNWMKGGIAHADAVNTVSPGYAEEILTPEFGCGLEGFLRRHRNKLRGILNGIDPEIYDPSKDPTLPASYDARDLRGKERCKEAYLVELGEKRKDRPLFAFIGRFVEQKGVQWVAEILDELGSLPLTLTLLGEGEERFHRSLEGGTRRHDNLHLRFGYDEALSHRIYAAADFLLMPSLFEPCGLNQMIAMRYGTLPLVHSVGGLKDTVHPVGSGVCGEGLSFAEGGEAALLETIRSALRLYGDRQGLERARCFDMGCDFSIGRCARNYLSLYRELEEKR
ncbi:glycogen synthase [Nitratifractor sp.]